jgi:hypothetical protein
MDQDRLKSLIEYADVAPPPQSASPLELADRVRILYRRRQHRRLTALAATATAAGIVLWFGVARQWRGDVAKSASETRIVLPPQIAHIDSLQETNRQIEREEAVVWQLLTAERRRQLDAMPDSTKVGLDRRLLPDEQVGQAAKALLMSADDRAKRSEGIPDAREDYAYLMRAFPNTTWAAQAGERLAALNP